MSDVLRCTNCCRSVPEALEFCGGRILCRDCLEKLIDNEKVTLDDLAAIFCAAVVDTE